MGIDASRSLHRNRSCKAERRKGFRNLLCENLERREVMAGSVLDTDFRLLSVAANTGEIFSNTRSNSLAESPRELIFRFAGGDDVAQATLRNGIRITRSGGDGVFGTGGATSDVIVSPSYLDFADIANKRVVVARFSQPLPDDLYSVEIFGVDIPSQGVTAIRSVDNERLKPRKSGTDRDTFQFNLELGTKIVAVVPQPIGRNASGILTPRWDQIDVYFNDGELYDRVVTTGEVTPNPSVVDLSYYKLILTQDSVSPNDDLVFQPTSIRFDPVARMATLTFADSISNLPGVNHSGTFRLRVGSSETVASAITPIVPMTPVVGADPTGSLSGAFALNSGTPLSSSYSAVLSQEIRNVTNFLPNDFPGSNFEPGHREIQDESHVGGPDENPEITTVYYSFMEGVPYGLDNNGRPVFTSITPDQKQRVREVFEFYSRKLGLDAIEFTGTSVDGDGVLKVVVGDLAPNSGPGGPVSGPGDVIGLAGGELAIMDGAEAWDNTFGLGSNLPNTVNFFTTAMHEIGHLLGYSHTYDLPPGTIMGDDGRLAITGTVAVEQVFPGDADVIHGQHMYRPDNRDVDLYRFVVAPGTTGRLRAETIAERLNNSSSADTHLTLFRLEADGSLTTVAANDNYFSQDSMVQVGLEAGEYFLSVTGSGNEDNNPLTGNSGSGARSQGRYQLRVDFEATTANRITEERSGSALRGSALDGDGDGLAGGDFNFWFRAASPVGVAPANSPRTLIVDKAFAGLVRDGAPATPFNRITEATAVAKPGDIIRLVGDTRTASLTDDAAYEIGFGGISVGTLSDGPALDVPRGVTLMIDSGAILKFAGSRILVGSSDSSGDLSGGAVQVLGIPGAPVYFTSYFDESLGRDTNPIVTTPRSGDWGGIEIRNDADRAQGRTSIVANGRTLSADREREGIFLNTISNANMAWGGGIVGLGAQAKVVSPIELAEARPLIIGNRITRSADSAISADPNSFEETLFTEPRYQNGGLFIPDFSRIGPVIYSNEVTNNSVNGLFVRVETPAGQPLKKLDLAGRINDSEITVVFGENLVIEGTPGGGTFENARPNASLMTLNNVAPGSGFAGFPVASTVSYLVTYVDRFGQESLTSTARTGNVAAGGAIELRNIPAATGEYVSRKIWRQVGGVGTYRLAGILNRDDTTFVDNNTTLNGALQNAPADTSFVRARRDASLVIDPGIVAKMLGGRIEVGIGATLLAEGSSTKPIVFTSRRDDRYGAGGTFDTNNDLAATLPDGGNWAGIISRHLGTLSIDNALISFGGGESRIPGGFASFNAVEIHQGNARIANSIFDNNASGATNFGTTNRDTRGINDASVIFVLASQPVIINNVFKENDAANTAAISINANALNATFVRDFGRSTGLNLRETIGIGNFGPLVQNNRLGANGLNGLRVRGNTLTTEAVWDDTDIVHILQSVINVPDYHTYGGLRLVSKADESLVVKAGSGAHILAEGKPLDIKDRIGGTVQILGQPGFPVVMTSLSDDTIGAGFDYAGNSLVDTNNNGPSTGISGSWRGITFTPFANDRNVDFRYEREADQISEGSNDFPSEAEDLGLIANNLNAGDENLRLGVTLTGSIASRRDIDVYRFGATAGSMVWIDIDQTSGSLDSVVELIDSDGNIIALSDNSIAESVAGSTYSNTGLIPAGRVLPLDQLASAKRNVNEPNAQVDFLGVNPLDAGLRVLLPGVSGSFRNYFIRVRSSNVSPEPGKSNPARLTDPTLLRDGITVGGYKMQLRLQQEQEIAGSTVRFADIRFATVGIDVQGGPMHSPLVGEIGEQDPDETNASDQSAIDIGNIIVNDRAGLSIAGNIASRQDIDWYNFTVSRDSIQQVSTTPNHHISVTFDIDYADGQGRANTQLWVYQRNATSGQLTLVATANDSNIQDDQPRVNAGADLSDLTRGSQGKRDAFLGPIELPPGEYTVAISNASVHQALMSQFSEAASGVPGSQTVRLEPLDSVRRIAEDRFDLAPPPPDRPTTNATPVQRAIRVVGTTLPNAIPFNLSDVTLFVASSALSASRMQFGNALTGAKDGEMTTDGTNPVNLNTSVGVNDIAVGSTGAAWGARERSNGTYTDANGGVIFGIDIGDVPSSTAGRVSGGSSGLETYGWYLNDADPPEPEVRRSEIDGTEVGDGMRFHALSFSEFESSTGAPTFWGVASRATRNEPTVFPITLTRNILYRLDPATGNALGDTRTGDARANGAATQIIERGNWNTLSGEVTGLASIGSQFYVVTNVGEFADPAGLLGTIRDPDTGAAINFTGLTRGPRNVEGGRYANMLFGVSTARRIYAFNTSGVLQPIFAGGRSFTTMTADMGNVAGIDFSVLDVNLWHVTDQQSSADGHGRNENFNDSRSSTPGDRSLRFGFADPNGLYKQPGSWSGINDVAAYRNAYNLPGGAMGAIETDLIDLRDYSADDQPVMYFNYMANIPEDQNDSPAGDLRSAMDMIRVYGAGEDGQWVLLATTNTAVDTDFTGLAPRSDEMDVATSGHVDAYGRSRVPEEIFDTGEWRQVRANLAPLAGKRDVRLRFEFSTGADFRSADPLRGGLELVVVPGERLSNGQTMTVGGATFEFDLGLVLNVPSGRSIVAGDAIVIRGNTFTFGPLAGPNIIPFTSADTPETLAASITTVLQAAGYTVATSTLTPNVINVTQLAGVPLPAPATATDYRITGADPNIIIGLPGVAAGNEPIAITNAMSATQVQLAIRQAFARRLNIVGQTTNIDVYRTRGNSIILHGVTVGSPGPLTVMGRLPGDLFGGRDGGTAWNSASYIRAGARTLSNTPNTTLTSGGIFIDDVVIGFAERGEMVTGVQNTLGASVFRPSRYYEQYGRDDGTPAQEIATGTYQLEIRASADYGTTNLSGDLRIEDTPIGPLGRTFNTNDRLTKSSALIFNAASEIVDGSVFTLSDGVGTARFEFEVVTSASDRRSGVTPGNIPVVVPPNSNPQFVARAIRNAINSPSAQALIHVTAENGGDMPFSTSTGARSQIIQLNGNAAVNALGGTVFPADVPLTWVQFGQDSQWGEDLGDANIKRDQGQLIIASTSVSNASHLGIRVDAAARDYASTRFPPLPSDTEGLTAAGDRPYPGAVRNLVTLNTSNVAPGVVIVNNVLAFNGSAPPIGSTGGAILLSGDAASEVGIPVASVARVVNNTIYGIGGSSVGLAVNESATPTILNNLFSNLGTGISVTSASPANTVLGGNLYKGNTTNVSPAGLSESFRINLGATDPLFMNPSAGRFYLAAQSQAIDSSMSSLENRSSMETVKAAIGLPTSPIIAPEFDANGLRRSDDPTVSSPPGLGANVFIDRGAIDRVDQIGPQAILQRPLDNDALGIDTDRTNSYIRVQSGNYDYFEILIDERQGTGPDPLTINKDNVVLTENGRILIPDVDYVFGYSYNSRTIRLTPLAGFWRQDSVYEVTLINKPTLRIEAPSDAATRLDGQTFTVSLRGGGSRILELDSGYTLTVPPAGVTDGDSFIYRTASGQTTVFEFNLAGNIETKLNTEVITFTVSDTRDTLAAKIASALAPFVRQNGWPVQAIGNGRVSVGGNVGDDFDVSGSSIAVSGNPGVSAIGRIPIRFLPIASFDAVAMANQLTKALNQIGAGVKAYALANGLVFVEGVSAITDFTTLSLAPINDLAGNLLQANRANSLTQFTILMPEVAVDYGDAVERTGTGSTSSTRMVDNGVRHAIYPDDATLLVLGASADGDTDGAPSNAADSDDFDSSLSLGTLSPFVSIDRNGPARLLTSSVSASSFGKTLSITDASGNSATYQFVNATNPLTNPAYLPVDLTGLTTSTQVATALKNAVLNSILAGSVTGIYAESTGNVVSLGGSRNHLFDLSGAGSEITRALSGTLGLTINSSLTGLAAGQSLSITDGSGNTVGFQIINSAAPTPVAIGNYAVTVNLATVTPAGLATALASAINTSIGDSRLRLPSVIATDASLVVSGDDEDGFSYNRWFNKDSLPTAVTLTASASGLIDAWIDWNQDNDFNDAGERILTSEPVLAGSNTFYVSTPTTAVVGFTTARFRLSSTGDQFTYGLAIGGEVEDHLIEVLAGSPPVGTNDTFTIAEDNLLVVSAPGVLFNDSDPDSNPIRVDDANRRVAGIQPVREPAYGYLTLNANGSFDYMPKQDFFGTDLFIYDVTDGRMTGNRSVTVTITVTPVNDAPVAVDDTVSILEDAVTTWNGSLFTANDRTQPDRPAGTDGDLFDTNESLQVLTVTNVELVNPRGFGESISVTSNQITYTPPTDYNNRINGPVLVRVLIQDSGVAGGDAAPKNPGDDDVPFTGVRYSTLTINIGDVNDRPQFTIPTPVETPLEDATVSKAGFLTDIAPSASTALDELGPTVATPSLVRQNVVFLVRALDPTRFTPTGQPAISPDGTLTYSLNTDVNFLNSGPILVEVIAEDNGDAPGSRPGVPDLNRSLPQTFTIRPTEVNDAPEFRIPSPLVSILEDRENSPLSGFVTDIFAGPSTARDERGEVAGVAGQTVRFVLEALDTTRFSVQPQISPTGVLTYDLAPDVNRLNSGDVIVRVYALDSGPAAGDRPGIPDINRSADQLFTIRITEVNDAPQFVIPNPIISINEDAEVSPLNGFVTNIQAGPDTARDERGLITGVAGQSVSFGVQALDPTRFSVQPQINASGNLTYDLRPDINLLNSGDIVVRVFAIDNGPAPGDRPGIPDVNQSADQFFTIRATEVNDPPQFIIPSPILSITEDLEISPIVGFLANIQAGPDTARDELGLITGIPGQSVSFVVQALDPSRFSVQPQISPAGTLTYDLAPDVNRLNSGDIVVRVYAVDSGPAAGDRPGIPDINRSADQFFTIRVAEINDAPQFTITTPVVSVFEDNEQVTGTTPTRINGFASNVRPGPSTAVDEVTQTLGFVVISLSNPNLFSVQPSIDPSGNLTFVTAADQNGTSVIVVRLDDNGVSSPAPNDNTSNNATFTIVVRPVNDAPQFTIPTTIVSDEDQGDVTLPDFARDIRPGPETAFDELRQELTFEVVARDPSVFEVQPSLSVDGTLTYKTAADLNSNAGKDTRVVVRLRDNGVSGPAPDTNVSGPRTFTVSINPINDPPVPGPFSTTTNEDTRITIQSSAVLAGALPGPGDEIAEPQTLRITNIESTTALNGVIEPVFVGGQIVEFKYTPPLNYVGVDTVRYVVTDSGTYTPGPRSATGTITINILAINDPPVFTSGGNVSVLEDSAPYAAAWASNIAAGPPSATDELTGPGAQTVSFEVTNNDSSMFSVPPAVSASGQLTFTLAKDANGQVAVVVTAVDSGLASPPPNNNRSRPSTFTITVGAVNDAPDFTVLKSVVVDEDSGAFSGQVLANIVPAIGNNATPPTALDESTQSITFTTTNDQTGLFSVQPSVSPTGILTFSTASNAVGTAVVRVFATDNGPSGSPNVNVSETKIFTITVGPVNDAPLAVDDRFNASETTILNVAAPGLLANDTDVDPDKTLSIATFQSTSDLGAQVSVNANGSFSYNPTVSKTIRELVDGQTINDKFTYRAKDSSNVQSNLATVTITVSGFNDAPVTVDDSFIVPFNSSKLLSVLDNDTDIDTPINVASIEIGILPVNGTAVPTADGKVRYTPTGGFRGTDSFTYRVRDSLGKVSAEATVSLRINTIPIANPDSFIAKQGVLTTLNVLSNDSDPDGTINPTTVTIVSQPNNATATVLNNGQIQFTSQGGFVGTSRFQYTVSDNDGSPSLPADVTVQVVASLYQNPTNRFDVNADSFVSPIDVLVIINLLNTKGPSVPVDGLPGPPDYVDVNGDNRVDPLDALAVINYINSGGAGGEGEGTTSMASSNSAANLGWTFDLGLSAKGALPSASDRPLADYGVARPALANAAQPLANSLRSTSGLKLADYLASLAMEDEEIESALAFEARERNRNAVDEALANLFDD